MSDTQTVIQQYQSKATIQIETQLDVLPLTDDLFAFRRNTSPAVMLEQVGASLHPVDRTPATVVEGVVDAVNLQKMTSGLAYKTRDLVLFTTDLIEDIRVYGWHLPFENEFNRPAFVADGHKRMRRDVFTAFSKGEATLDNLVRPDYSKFVFFDHQDQPLPVGLKFDYMNGLFDETHYDLIKAAEHLLTRSDVTLLTYPAGSYSRRTQNDMVAAHTATSAVLDIPSYNATEDRTRQIMFRWAPTVEDYRKLVSAIGIKNLGLTSKFYQEAARMDLFGLRAAGACREPTFY